MGSEPTPGAAGIGDPYFPTYGNGGYRVSHYDISVAYRPGPGRLTGTTKITARATKDLSRFNLDLLLRATSVRVDGQPAAWRHRDELELAVTPATPVARGETFSVVVGYTGVPEDVRYNGIGGWMSPERPALALGEPEVAAWWFPSNDHPADKATFDITASVPDGLEAISNGRLVSRQDVDGRDEWHWRLGSPAATYLAFLAIGQYDLDAGTRLGREYLNAYAKSLSSGEARAARRSIGATAAITNFFAGKFGRYPFSMVGGVVPPMSVGFALENQTRPVYSRAFFGGVNTNVVAHEMAHQWFGDSVAVRRWKHIWLNEGFASYAAWMWQGHRGGSSPEKSFESRYRAFGENDPFWRLSIGDPGAEHLFSYPVYDRGAMTLQALRNKLGHQQFFTVLSRWATSHRGGNGTTAAFIALAEQVAGQHLDRFFDVWLINQRRPAPIVANGFPPNFHRFAPPSGGVHGLR